MKFLKSLALGLFGFFLFLFLSIFGFAFQLNQTILNPDFITAELDELDVSSLAEELISEQILEEEFPEELGAAIVSTITYLESSVKEQVSAATHSIYDYLLGKTESLDLALTLKNTILNPDFIVSLVDKFDISSLVGEFLSQQITEEAPEEAEYLADYLDEYLDDVITDLEPWLKEQISAAADPTVDYLLGEIQSLNIAISLEPVMESLEDTLREAFLASPPARLLGLPFPELEREFDKHFGELAESMPATFEFDQSSFGAERPADIAEALAEVEERLEQARPYIGYFQLGYKVLIGLMALLVLGIILISRQVKDVTRRLGVPLLTYGAIEYAGIFVAKYFIDRWSPWPEIPASLETWTSRLLDNLLAPLEMFSLGLLIGGIVLIIVSFVYKPRQPSS